MYQFSVKIANCTLHEAVWEDTGFICIGGEESIEQAIDVLILAPDDNNKLEQIIMTAHPKVFIVLGRYDPSPELADLYAQYRWKLHDILLTVGTFLEVPLPEPIWEAYFEQHEKAIADTIYRHLLNDIFRETAEWCGHMSSVVRPI